MSARALYSKLASKIDASRRARVRFASSGGIMSQPPRVFFLAPDNNNPSGGRMALYRHVDILRSAAISAYALHWSRGFRYSWFENTTPATSLGQIQLTGNDLMVVSELDVDLLPKLPPDVRYVIFNQSGHLTWERSAEQVNRHYLNHPNLAAVVTVSEHAKTLLQSAFVDLDVRRIHLGINQTIFWAPAGSRPNRIAYMPRRGRADAELVLTLLANWGALKDWDVIALDGLSHAEVAEQLRSSRIFLSCPYQEGFGLPAAEAMACGNYVVGYHGYGGREFFHPDFSMPIETGDVLSFAQAVQGAMQKDRLDPDWCIKRGLAASAFVLAEYSEEREASEIIELYRELLKFDEIGIPERSRAVS